uniref:Transposase n=1 Tax=Parastrongyloides trichosuri TaxID=131310 RepID=A0A0N4ZGV2_PARTI
MLRPGAERVARLGGLHEFVAGKAHPDRFRRLSGHEPVGHFQVDRGSRHLLQPHRWLQTRPDARTLDSDSGRPPRLRHRHAVGRMRRLARRGKARPRGHGAVGPLGATLEERLRHARCAGPVRHPAGLDL